jgi:hypothetical protein
LKDKFTKTGSKKLFKSTQKGTEKAHLKTNAEISKLNKSNNKKQSEQLSQVDNLFNNMNLFNKSNNEKFNSEQKMDANLEKLEIIEKHIEILTEQYNKMKADKNYAKTAEAKKKLIALNKALAEEMKALHNGKNILAGNFLLVKAPPKKQKSTKALSKDQKASLMKIGGVVKKDEQKKKLNPEIKQAYKKAAKEAEKKQLAKEKAKKNKKNAKKIGNKLKNINKFLAHMKNSVKRIKKKVIEHKKK